MAHNEKSIAVSGGLKRTKMNIAQKIIEAHRLKFGSLPPLQQCSVSGSALFNADCMDILTEVLLKLSNGKILLGYISKDVLNKYGTLKVTYWRPIEIK